MTIFSRTGSDTRRQSSYRTEPPFSSFLAGTGGRICSTGNVPGASSPGIKSPFRGSSGHTIPEKRCSVFIIPKYTPSPGRDLQRPERPQLLRGSTVGGESENFGVLGSTPNKHIFCICTHTCIACQYSCIRHRGTGLERTVPASNASVYTLAAAALVGETPQAP